MSPLKGFVIYCTVHRISSPFMYLSIPVVNLYIFPKSQLSFSLGFDNIELMAVPGKGFALRRNRLPVSPADRKRRR